MKLKDIVAADMPLGDPAFRTDCRETLDRDGAVVLPGFVKPAAVARMREEGEAGLPEAYFCTTSHNVYLTEPRSQFAPDHPCNREVVSSKGLIADDQVPDTSPLKTLYRDETFRDFVADVVGEDGLFPYADPLSAVNIHFAKNGQELGWHFDNSSFAITLLIEKPEGGGVFEYVKDVRDADSGEMNYPFVGKLLDGEVVPDTLEMEPGTLVLFRGRNSIHRVTPTKGQKTRMLAVLAYNSEPGISLSESARMTFYGRLS